MLHVLLRRVFVRDGLHGVVRVVGALFLAPLLSRCRSERVANLPKADEKANTSRWCVLVTALDDVHYVM